jgi:hypothetical protein
MKNKRTIMNGKLGRIQTEAAVAYFRIVIFVWSNRIKRRYSIVRIAGLPASIRNHDNPNTKPDYTGTASQCEVNCSCKPKVKQRFCPADTLLYGMSGYRPGVTEFTTLPPSFIARSLGPNASQCQPVLLRF